MSEYNYNLVLGLRDLACSLWLAGDTIIGDDQSRLRRFAGDRDFCIDFFGTLGSSFVARTAEFELCVMRHADAQNGSTT